MNPALSVIFFTTLSGAGYGLWMWLGLRMAFGPRGEVFEPIGWLMLLLGGIVLTCAGITASLWHLGKPMRVWRAFSQWRSSWMSREGVMAVASLIAAVLVLLPLHDGHHPGLRALGALLALCALGTVCSTAMIYASLKPIPAWRHPLVLPVYVVFALLVGGLAYAATMYGSNPLWGWMRWVLLGLAALAAVMKTAYWLAIDATPLPQTRGDAVGMPTRTLSVFEHPHTEANYLTREMGFVIVRRHARVLRLIAILLFALVPALVLALHPAPALLWVAAISALAGSLFERWLFFAQARHMVTLYY